MQYITKEHKFDTMHRVMDERMKCFKGHGHTYKCELTFSFDTMKDIGYPIDFKELKRVGCAWIDDYFDHNAILNPKDTVLIKAFKDVGTEPWIMTLKDGEYCNPTAENISRELFMVMELLFSDQPFLMYNVRLYETDTCWTDCNATSIPLEERVAFYTHRMSQIEAYKQQKGVVEYDARRCGDL